MHQAGFHQQGIDELPQRQAARAVAPGVELPGEGGERGILAVEHRLVERRVARCQAQLGQFPAGKPHQRRAQHGQQRKIVQMVVHQLEQGQRQPHFKGVRIAARLVRVHGNALVRQHARHGREHILLHAREHRDVAIAQGGVGLHQAVDAPGDPLGLGLRAGKQFGLAFFLFVRADLVDVFLRAEDVQFHALPGESARGAQTLVAGVGDFVRPAAQGALEHGVHKVDNAVA